MDDLPNITSGWALGAFAIFQIIQLVKSILDKREITSDRAITKQRRDENHSLLVQRQEQIEKRQDKLEQAHDALEKDVVKQLSDIRTDVGYIRGILTPVERRPVPYK